MTDLDDDPAALRAQRDLALKALSVIRHDLRNLLASVSIISGRMETSGDERLAKAGPLLLASMERVVNLGVRAGDLASAERGAPVPVRIEAALKDEVIDALDIEVSGTNAAVLADPVHVTMMLRELLLNAAAAGGPVRVEASSADGKTVRIDVRDDGPGIPDYAQSDLFTPFKGAKRRDGAGVGLPLSTRLASFYGGSLSLLETGPDGSAFRLTLPAA